jgi:hypothetical protein
MTFPEKNSALYFSLQRLHSKKPTPIIDHPAKKVKRVSNGQPSSRQAGVTELSTDILGATQDPTIQKPDLQGSNTAFSR